MGSDMFRIKGARAPLFQKFLKISRPASLQVCFPVTQHNFSDREMKEECANLICPPCCIDLYMLY